MARPGELKDQMAVIERGTSLCVRLARLFHAGADAFLKMLVLGHLRSFVSMMSADPALDPII